MAGSIFYDKYVFTYVPYVDVNIWILLLGISLLFFILSYVSPRARMMFSGLSVLFGVAVMWGSLGLARIGYAVQETVITHNQTIANLTTSVETTSYIQVVESLTGEWLTTLCRVYVIIILLSFIWIIIENYFPNEEISQLKESGVDVGSLGMTHDDKLHRVGGEKR